MRRWWRRLVHVFHDLAHLVEDLGRALRWLWRKVRGVIKWLAVIAACYIVLFVGVFSYQMISAAIGDPDADLVDKTEEDRRNRVADTAAIVESVRRFLNNYRTPEYQRDAHAKPHGCLRAEFEVFDIESRYNHGLFAKPATYQAWVRYSNGTVPSRDDTLPDARGMAVKVMDVPGEQLLPPLLAGRTQDFLMVDSPAFFIRSVSGYRELEKLTADGKPFTYFLGQHYLNPFKWRLRELYLGLKSRKKAPSTPLSTQYFSMSAYQLGPHQIKFSAKPCEAYEVEGIDRTTPNFLRSAMKKLMRDRDACYQFMVQVRDPDARMPIQDTTVVWSEKDAPFVPVARIQFPRQQFDSAEQNAMCDALSFNPWHGTKPHRPLGYLNELRRELYLHTAAFRRVRNDQSVSEPASWCDSMPRYCDLVSGAAR